MLSELQVTHMCTTVGTSTGSKSTGELLKAQLQPATTGSNHLPPTNCHQLSTTPATPTYFYVALTRA